MTDREAMDQYRKKHSEKAFQKLIERYSPMVYSACLRILDNPSEAEEVVHLVFATLAQKAPYLSRNVLLSGWLFREAVYEAGRIKKEKGLEQKISRSSKQKTDSSWEEIRPYLDQALASLPERLQDGMVLHFLKGETQRKTALMLNCEEKTLHVQINRALEKLRSALTHQGITISNYDLSAFLSSRTSEAFPEEVLTHILDSGVKAPKGILGTTLIKLINITARNKIAAVITIIIIGIAVTIVQLKEEHPIAPVPVFKKTFAKPKIPQVNSNKSFSAKSDPVLRPLSLEEKFKVIVTEIIPEDTYGNKVKDALEKIASKFIAEQAGEKALLLASEIRPPKIREYFVRELFANWATQNPHFAAERAEKIPEGPERLGALEGTAIGWAQLDSPSAAGWAAKLPGEYEAGMASYSVALIWAEKDSLSALQWASQIPQLQSVNTSQLSNSNLPPYKHTISRILDIWMKKDFKSVALWIQQQPEDKNSYWVTRAALYWAETNPKAAIKWVTQFSKKIQNNTISYIIDQVGTQSPQVAVNLIKELPNGETRNNAIELLVLQLSQKEDFKSVKSLLEELVSLSQKGELRDKNIAMMVGSGWAKLDPGSAVAYANQMLQGESRSSAIGSILWKWSQSNPKQAYLWIQQLPKNQHSKALNLIFSGWADKDLQAALQHIGQLPEAERADAQHGIIKVWKYNDPQAAAQWVGKLAEGEQKENLLLEIAYAWTSSNAVQASQWAEKLPNGKIADEIWPKLAVELADQWPQTGYKWLARLPEGVARDKAISSFASRIASTNPEVALQLTNDMSDEYQRTETITKIAKTWLRNNRSEAIEWIKNSSLPQVTKTVLLSQ